MNETVKMINEIRAAQGKGEIGEELANKIKLAEMAEENARNLIEGLRFSDQQERIDWAYNEYAAALRGKCEAITAALAA